MCTLNELITKYTYLPTGCAWTRRKGEGRRGGKGGMWTQSLTAPAQMETKFYNDRNIILWLPLINRFESGPGVAGRVFSTKSADFFQTQSFRSICYSTNVPYRGEWTKILSANPFFEKQKTITGNISKHYSKVKYACNCSVRIARELVYSALLQLHPTAWWHREKVSHKDGDRERKRISSFS